MHLVIEFKTLKPSFLDEKYTVDVKYIASCTGNACLVIAGFIHRRNTAGPLQCLYSTCSGRYYDVKFLRGPLMVAVVCGAA